MFQANIAALVCIAAVSCAAQSIASPPQSHTTAHQGVADTAPVSDRFPASWYPPADQTVSTGTIPAGAPYTASQVMRGIQHAANGTPEQSYVTRARQLRDGAGRLRSESPNAPDIHGSERREVTVDDPVSHCRFSWMEPLPAAALPGVASVTCMARTVYRSPDPLNEARFRAPATEEKDILGKPVFIEPLGDRTISGIHALGMRESHPGTRSGNEARDTEVWWSPELKETLLLVVHGKDSDYSLGLEDIVPGEPPAELFYPPRGYKIEALLPR